MIIRQLNENETHITCVNANCGLGAIAAVEYDAQHPITHTPPTHYVVYVCFRCAKDVIDTWEQDSQAC